MTSYWDISHRLFHGGSALTRFSHRARLRTAVELLGDEPIDTALDFGCGDGWFLAHLAASGRIRAGIGVDDDPGMVAKAAERGLPSHRFVLASDSCSGAPADVAFCMETLEHVADPDRVIDRILELVRPGGRVVLSVPIEVGPALLIKQCGRMATNWIRPYGYERYGMAELTRAGLGWKVPARAPARPGHKGFDFRRIERLLAERVEILAKRYSPFSWLGPMANATVFWVGKKAA